MNDRIQHIGIHQLLGHLRTRELSQEEWASLEAFAAGDHFLMEAIEGLRQIPPAQRSIHLRSIQLKLTQKYPGQRTTRRMAVWMTAAASVLVLIGMIWIVNHYNRTDENTLVAEDMSIENESVSSPGELAYGADSMVLADGDQELPSEAFSNPRLQPLSTPERSIASNEAREKKPESGGEKADVRRRDASRAEPNADRARPMLSDARSTEPGSTEISPSEELSEDARASDSSAPFPEVKGIVMNRSGEPVIGAQISVKGTAAQTETDYLGNFALDIPNQNLRNALVISYDVYPAIEADVSDGDSLVVRLQEAAHNSQADVTTLSQKRVSATGNPGSRALALPLVGSRGYLKYIRQNLRYPLLASSAGVHGTVVVEFDVDTDGSPKNARIIQSLGYGCDEEAIRLILEGPKWSTHGQVNIGRWEVTF